MRLVAEIDVRTKRPRRWPPTTEMCDKARVHRDPGRALGERAAARRFAAAECSLFTSRRG